MKTKSHIINSSGQSVRNPDKVSGGQCLQLHNQKLVKSGQSVRTLRTKCPQLSNFNQLTRTLHPDTVFLVISGHKRKKKGVFLKEKESTKEKEKYLSPKKKEKQTRHTQGLSRPTLRLRESCSFLAAPAAGERE